MITTSALVYLAITAATAGFTGCAACVEFVERKDTKWFWLALTGAAVSAVVGFITHVKLR